MMLQRKGLAGLHPCVAVEIQLKAAHLFPMESDLLLAHMFALDLSFLSISCYGSSYLILPSRAGLSLSVTPSTFRL